MAFLEVHGIDMVVAAYAVREVHCVIADIANWDQMVVAQCLSYFTCSINFFLA